MPEQQQHGRDEARHQYDALKPEAGAGLRSSALRKAGLLGAHLLRHGNDFIGECDALAGHFWLPCGFREAAFLQGDGSLPKLNALADKLLEPITMRFLCEVVFGALTQFREFDRDLRNRSLILR